MFQNAEGAGDVLILLRSDVLKCRAGDVFIFREADLQIAGYSYFSRRGDF